MPRAEVWVERSCFTAIVRAASASHPLETGGLLVGYRREEHQVIEAVIQAGPHARHAPDRFEPDHEWQCEQLDSLYLRSNGRLAYLGEWHSHPNSSASMSSLDKRTLRSIAKYSPAHSPHPLMLIAAAGPVTWRIQAHVYRGRGLLGFRSTFIASVPVIFDGSARSDD